MWFAALLHGIVTEVICYNLPDINNFWHAQTSLIFLGQRFPLYIVLFYPATVSISVRFSAFIYESGYPCVTVTFVSLLYFVTLSRSGTTRESVNK